MRFRLVVPTLAALPLALAYACTPDAAVTPPIVEAGTFDTGPAPEPTGTTPTADAGPEAAPPDAEPDAELDAPPDAEPDALPDAPPDVDAAPPPPPLTVHVVDLKGAPFAGADVYVTDDTGSPVVMKTDAKGIASSLVTPGSTVTVTRLAPHQGSGVTRRLVSIVAVQPGDVIELGADDFSPHYQAPLFEAKGVVAHGPNVDAGPTPMYAFDYGGCEVAQIGTVPTGFDATFGSACLNATGGATILARTINSGGAPVAWAPKLFTAQTAQSDYVLTDWVNPPPVRHLVVSNGSAAVSGWREQVAFPSGAQLFDDTSAYGSGMPTAFAFVAPPAGLASTVISRFERGSGSGTERGTLQIAPNGTGDITTEEPTIAQVTVAKIDATNGVTVSWGSDSPLPAGSVGYVEIGGRHLVSDAGAHDNLTWTVVFPVTANSVTFALPAGLTGFDVDASGWTSYRTFLTVISAPTLPPAVLRASPELNGPSTAPFSVAPGVLKAPATVQYTRSYAPT